MLYYCIRGVVSIHQAMNWLSNSKIISSAVLRLYF